MDLRELGYFNAVYEEGSVTAAARRCFISQPSVSAAIVSLEQELSQKLFVRSRTGAVPTSSAEDLYPLSRKLCDDASALKVALRPREPAQRITLGLMRSLDVERVRDVLMVLSRSPRVLLKVVAQDEPSEIRVVSKGLVSKGETFVPLWSERFVVALPSAHPLALRKTLRSTDLANERLIERCHCEITRHMPRGRRRVDVAAVAQSEEWALALVGAGVGIAIVPGGVRADPSVALRELSDVKVARQVGIAYAKRALGKDIVQLVDDVRRRFGAND